jgi:cellulose synthase/poly-beta-1,6-N-acetylglucosamine synthase-like glycosyltransferase
MILLYILSGLAVVQGIVALIQGIRAAQYMRRGRIDFGIGNSDFGFVVPTGSGCDPNPKSEFRNPNSPHVSVFCPCRGIDLGFDENIQSILAQDYSNFEVLFIVESIDDPAWTALQRLGISNVLAAGQANDCGQKVHNLLYAINHADPRTDMYVFCDSDARYPRHWLADLTKPLADPWTGVTTGYRWYVAESGSAPTLLRSAWNASVVGLLGDHDRNFAWGGSTAMRRETFDRLHIREAWDGALSDDYAITRAARMAGVHIRFVPSCLVPSYGECGWRELLEFTTRQIKITRVYHPGLWRAGLFAQTLFSTAFIALTIAAPASASAGALLFVIYALAAGKSWIRLNGVLAILPRAALSKYTWFYILSSPVVALLFVYNMLRSAFSKEIMWRHIRYSLISPNKTLVLGRRRTQ